MTPRLTPERVRELLAAATPGPIDVHRCDADGGAIDYQLQRGAGTGGTVLGYATDHDGSPRAKADALLWSRASDLAADVLALHDALARVTREREAAVAARDALVTAVREYMDSSRAAAGDYLRATLADDHKAALADVDRRHSGRRLNATARLTALLDGAPADVVRGDVVRAYLAAADAYDTAGLRVLEDDEVNDITESEARDAARAALDAALAAGGGR